MESVFVLGDGDGEFPSRCLYSRRLWLLSLDHSFCQLHKFIALNLTVSQNFGHQSWANDFTAIHRDNSPPAVGMAQKMMTSLLHARLQIPPSSMRR
jgi:hypothetical protein